MSGGYFSAGGGKSPYFTGSGGGSAYFGGGSHGAAAPAHHGILHNLVTDIGDAARGIPEGFVQTAEHPIRTAKVVGHAYAKTYSPLIHGHFTQFAHGVYEHPLGPLLDAATILTLPFGVGEGLAGSRVARALAEGSQYGKGVDALESTSKLIRGSAKLGGKYKHGTLRGSDALSAAGLMKGVNGIEDAGIASGNILPFERSGLLPRRMISAATDAMLKKLPADTHLVGELARYGRLAKKLTERGPRALGIKEGEFSHAISKLKGDLEPAVYFLKSHGITPLEYVDLLKSDGARVGHTSVEQDKLIEVFSSPELKAVYDSAKDNARIGYAVKIGRKFSETLTAMRKTDVHEAFARATKDVEAQTARRIAKIDPAAKNANKLRAAANEWKAGKLADHAAERDESIRRLTERPYLAQRLVRGAVFGPAVKDLLMNKMIDEYRNAHDAYSRILKKSDNSDENVALDEAARRMEIAADQLHKREALFAKKHFKLQSTKDVTEAHLDELRAAFQEKGPGATLKDTATSTIDAIKAEGGEEPFYMPHMRPSEDGATPTYINRNGGGKGPVDGRPDPYLKQNRGILLLSGQLSLDPKVLGTAFHFYARRALYSAIHDVLLENAIQVENLPKGWTWIKEKSSQVLPKDAAATNNLHINQITAKGARPAEYGVSHLAVPENLVKELAGEFTRSDRFIRNLWERPVAVWRAIVLNLRVGFLVNNIVGQMFMLHFRLFGPTMLKAWSSYIRDTKPGIWNAFQRDVLRQNVERLPQRSFKGTEIESTPEVMFGTGYRSQEPFSPIERDSFAGAANSAVKKTGEIARAAAHKGGELSAKWSEDIPREVAMRHQVMKIATRMGEKIPRETEEFNKLAQRVLADPHNADRALTEVNKALGEYTGMGDFERHVVRQIVPFYGWLRAITKVVMNSAVDTPGRSALITRIGTVGAEATQNQLGPLPEWLRGLVPVGNHVLATQGLNPYATIPDVIRGGSALVSGKPGDLGTNIAPNLNPFLIAALEQLSGKNPVTNQPPERLPLPGGRNVPNMGLLGNILQSNILELPPVHLAAAWAGRSRETKTYGKQDGLQALLSYLGVPVKPRPR